MPEELRPATWDDIIRAEAKGARVPPELALAIADTESGFDPAAISPKGARGIFQLMPETAKELGVDPDDPVQNIRGGLKYFRQQLDAHGGNVEKALQSYNWGPTNVAGGGTPPAETQQYVSKILSRLGGVTAANVTKPAPVTLKDMTRNIAKPPPGAPSGSPAEGPSVFDKSLLRQTAEGFDPRTPTGRRNLAGAGGAALGTAAVVGTAPVSMPVLGVSAAVAGIAGATGGGILAESGEQLVGTKPPSSTAILGAGAEQGVYEGIGHGVMGAVGWPFKRAAGTKVGRFAAKHFETTLDAARDAITSARQVASDAVTAGKAAVQSVIGGPPPIRSTAAGEAAHAVIRGPAQQAKEEIGQLVDEAAQSGPPVDITALKAEAHRILGEEIRPAAEAFPRAGAQESKNLPIDDVVKQLQGAAQVKLSPEELAKRSPSQRAAAQAIQTALAKAQEDQAATTLKHPAMAVLGRIINAEDTVPFHAAHLFKRELDEAIGTAWDKSVRSRVTNITKTARGTLREALGVHEPYNQATAAYQAIAPLYTKGLAPKLRRVAVEDPEAVVRLINPKKPTETAMLRDLLVGQSAKVGQEQAGQQAWDGVRSAWTAENITGGPIEKLGTRLDKLDKDFAHVMYGDPAGQTVLTNLRSISTAYQQGRAASEAAIKQAVSGLKGARHEARSFTQSTVARGYGDMMPDVLRAVVLTPGIWGLVSLDRLLHGPASKDLLLYAAYSPQRTQLLIHALTDTEAGAAAANFLRMAVPAVLGEGALEAVQSGVGTPPPRAQGAGPNARRDTSGMVGAPPP